MFCQNGTSYLEVSLNFSKTSDLEQFSVFCWFSINLIRYASIPCGVLIMFSTACAFVALRYRFANSSNGTGVIFMTALVLDFLNGLMCLRLSEQMFRGVLSFNDSLVVVILEWITWSIIFISWMLKFFLCCYSMHRFMQSSIFMHWYPFSNYNNPPPLTCKRGVLAIVMCVVVTLFEMTAMYLLEKHQATNHLHANTVVPFLGFQNMLQWACSLVVGAIYLFTQGSRDASQTEKFVTGTIGLSCLFTILANSLMTYGDFSCIFGYPTPAAMKPACYSILARFIGYSDSLFFSLIQFRSKAVRECFMSVLRGEDVLNRYLSRSSSRRHSFVSRPRIPTIGDEGRAKRLSKKLSKRQSVQTISEKTRLLSQEPDIIVADS